MLGYVMVFIYQLVLRSHFQIRPVSPASTISSSLRQEAGNRHQSTVDNMMRK